MTSSIGGCSRASSFRRLTVRTGSASASAMACSFQPSLLQPLDGAPDIDVVHRGADEVFRQRFHRHLRVVAVPHEHVDHGHVGADGCLHAALTGLDHQIAVDLAHDGWLDDADRGDRRQQLVVHRLRRRRLAGVVRIGLQRARIDAAKFGHGELLVGWFVFPCSRGDPPRRPDRAGPGQGRSRRSRACAPRRA